MARVSCLTSHACLAGQLPLVSRPFPARARERRREIIIGLCDAPCWDLSGRGVNNKLVVDAATVPGREDGKYSRSSYGIEWPLLVCTDCRSGLSTIPLRLMSSRKLAAVTG